MDVDEIAVDLGDVIEVQVEKRQVKKGKKKRKMKEGSSVGDSLENNLEAGTCDGVLEGELLVNSSHAGAENMISDPDTTEKVVNVGGVLEGNKDLKKEKKRKRKQDVPMRAILKDSSVIECENLTSRTQINGLKQAAGNQACEGTEIHDGAQEGDLLLESSYVRADDNNVSHDKGIHLDMTEGVVTPSNLHCEEKDKKVSKKRKKQVVSVAAISDQNPETRDENFAIPTQNKGLEQIAEGQAFVGTKMHDGTQEFASVSENPLVTADDNIVSEDRSTIPNTTENIDTPANLHVEQKIQKNRTKHKTKKPLSAAVNLDTKSENLTSQTQINGIENATGNQALEGTEIVNKVQNPPHLADKIVYAEKSFDTVTTKNAVTLGTLEKKMVHRTPSTHKRKQAVSAAAAVPEKNSETECENSCHDEIIVATSNRAHLESMETVDEMPGTTSGEDLSNLGKLKENEACTNNVCSLLDVVADQKTQTPNGQSLKKKKKKKKNMIPTKSQRKALQDGERLGNDAAKATSIRAADIVISAEGIMSLADKNTDRVTGNVSGNKLESGTDMENRDGQGMKGMNCIIGIVKPPHDTEKDQTVQEELVGMDSLAENIKFSQESQSSPCQFTAHSRENNCKPEIVLYLKKNEVSADHAANASDVDVTDTEKPDSGKKKKKKRCPVSVLPQLEYSDGTKDANMEPSIANDTESMLSREQNNVAIGEGIPKTNLISTGSKMDVCGPVSSGEAIHENNLLPSPERNRGRSLRRKLLILDINGLLADITAHVPPGYKPDTMLSRKAVFQRPFCQSFLQFCFENFDVGVWSSRVKKNVDNVLNFLMGKMKNKLIFYWDRSHCTITGFPTIENREKPLVLKELRKLWEDHRLHRGMYDQSSTLLLDDSPYKALRNPAGTAIFPVSYQYTDVNDYSLGPGGDLRVYLERLALADNIPEYMSNNPFGQRPIRETNLSWKYYKKVLESHSSRSN